VLKRLLFIAGITFTPLLYASSPVYIFTQDSYKELLANNDNAFIMVLWSLDCPPCIEELSMLGDVYHKTDNLNLVLVSTDSLSRMAEINQQLIASGLSAIDSWVFDSIPIPRLRYSIDPGWYGELPRSYFFTKNHSRKALSGRLNAEQIMSWLKNNSQVQTYR